MEERLHKILSQWGIASRRQAEIMILAGRVQINGTVVTQLGRKANPQLDCIEVDGRAIASSNRPRTRYIFYLNKPLWGSIYLPRSQRAEDSSRSTTSPTCDRSQGNLPCRALGCRIYRSTAAD